MIKNAIKEVFVGAMAEAHRMYLTLGEEGTQELNDNQFGNRVLKMDVGCERAIIDFLKKEKVPVKIYSEEHGLIQMVDDPKFLVVLDGLDGSYRFRDDWKNARSGTIFGIFDGVNPLYDDYLISGFYEHVNNKLYFVEKEKGAWVMSDGIVDKLATSNVLDLSDDVKIYADFYWEFDQQYYRKIISRYRVSDPAIAGVYYSDLSGGDCDVVLRCSGKQNLEMMVMYGVVKEAGGVVIDKNGEDIGNRKYLQFGQDEDNKEVMMAAASKSLANEVVKFLEKK